jgi:hypothetical protein
VEFRFDQPMDASSFDVAQDVRSFTGPGGVSLLGDITGFDWPDAATLRISFRPRATEGLYTIAIGPQILAADDHAPMDQDRDKVPGETGQDYYLASFLVTSRVGPDGFGYEARETPYEPIDLRRSLAPGGQTFVILDGEDDAAGAVPLGANTFNFYGESYAGPQSLFVSSNGLITFTRGFVGFANGELIDQPDLPTIAPLWDDWRTDTGPADLVLGAFQDADRDGVADRLVIEWSGMRRYLLDASDDGSTAAPPEAAVTFQAILSLNTGPGVPGAIVFNYPDLDTGDAFAGGGSATVGIKDSGAQGNRRLLVSRDNARHPWVATGRAVRISRPPAAVAGRWVFYNHSASDGGNSAADASDDAAVAPDKSPLLPGRGPTFANSTSYSRGINGVMVDVARLPPGALSARDFAFNVAAAPSDISVRRGAGVEGSDRVTLLWPDSAIVNQWLRVTVLPTPATGLAGPDVFSFGNLIGDTGDAAAGRAVVTVLDLLRTRAHFSASASSDNPFDFNRDGRVNGLDLAVTRANQSRTLPILAPTAASSPHRLDPPSWLLEDSAPAAL